MSPRSTAPGSAVVGAAPAVAVGWGEGVGEGPTGAGTPTRADALVGLGVAFGTVGTVGGPADDGVPTRRKSGAGVGFGAAELGRVDSGGTGRSTPPACGGLGAGFGAGGLGRSSADRVGRVGCAAWATPDAGPSASAAKSVSSQNVPMTATTAHARQHRPAAAEYVRPGIVAQSRPAGGAAWSRSGVEVVEERCIRAEPRFFGESSFRGRSRSGAACAPRGPSPVVPAPSCRRPGSPSRPRRGCLRRRRLPAALAA